MGDLWCCDGFFQDFPNLATEVVTDFLRLFSDHNHVMMIYLFSDCKIESGKVIDISKSMQSSN
jgi:hypothetical protein